MKHKFLTLILLSIFRIANGQDYEVIQKISVARENLYLDLFKNDYDIIEVDKLKVDKIYSIVNIDEKEKLLLLTNSFDEYIKLFLNDYRYSLIVANNKVNRNKSAMVNQEFYYSGYIYDSLSIKIDKDFLSRKNDIQNSILNCELPIEDKQFAELVYLFQILALDFCDKEIEGELLDLSCSFLYKYPKSKYSIYVTEYFNIVYKESPWGIGGYFNTGAIIPTGNLSDYVSIGIPINFGLTLNYNKIFVFAGLGPGIGGNIKKDLYYQKQWNSGDQLIYSMGELCIGYNIVDLNKLGITPIIGIGGAGLSPNSKDDPEYYDNVENITPYNNLIYGVNFDFRWAKSNCKSKTAYGRGAGTDYYFMITRLSIAYTTPKYEKTVDGLDGSLWLVKIGIGYQYQFKQRKK